MIGNCVLAFKTIRHQVFVTIPGIFSCNSDTVDAYLIQIDKAIDDLCELLCKDDELLSSLKNASTRDQAYSVIVTHLPKNNTLPHWMRRDNIDRDVYRRVLFLLCPTKFGFQTYGWIH